MYTYIPKIMIIQQSGTDKPGYTNEDGELQLFIEEDLTQPDKNQGNK